MKPASLLSAQEMERRIFAYIDCSAELISFFPKRFLDYALDCYLPIDFPIPAFLSYCKIESSYCKWSSLIFYRHICYHRRRYLKKVYGCSYHPHTPSHRR